MKRDLPNDSLLRQRMANAIRMLAADAVQKANSGHPGMPMGMAEIALALWTRHLRHNPANPQWANRDRFVISNGHGSMLHYSLLHLTGYDLPIDELRNFRQLHSKTPGHPEVGETPGIETTTGPLGQGVSNAVGMALAEKLLAEQFNRPGHTVVDHHTYVFVGDGCLMEGVSHEACALAGTWKLGKLIVLYDDNGISIDGDVRGWFTDDTAGRFEAYGWHVARGVNGHDVDAVDAAIREAQAETVRPSLICCRTVIGHGAPNKAGSADVHGSALGEAEVAATRQALGWTHPPFEVPKDLYAAWDARPIGAEAEHEWGRRFAAYRAAFPELAAEFERRMRGELPATFAKTADALVAAVVEKAETIATRKASQVALNTLGPALPELIGGSADLTGSNLTDWKGVETFTADSSGRHIHFGVREFGMTAILNGLALHGGFIPYGGTFLVFSDYARSAVRMGAMMRQRVVHVYTHDSIGLGEDGPTHQPVEHASSLRLIPNLAVWRPCDTVETAVAWRSAIERGDGPTALLLSRQNLPFVARDEAQLANVARGGYVLREAKGGRPRAILIATGSEVDLALKAQAELEAGGIPVRVVSMPSTTAFDGQSADYRGSVLPDDTPAVVVEAGATGCWWKYVRGRGAVIGLDRFGASAPAGQLFKHFGFTPEAISAVVRAALA